VGGRVAGRTGAAPRASSSRRAIALGGERDPLLHERLAVPALERPRDLALATAERAVELAPPGSAERRRRWRRSPTT
jgi:hypothetical protein